MKRREKAPPRSAKTTRSSCDLIIEGGWLFALAFVPLAFNGPDWFYFFSEPKVYGLHFAALTVVVAWACEMAFALPGAQPRGERTRTWNLFAGAGRDPARWALVAAGGFAFWQLLSTLASPLPVFSALGRDINNPGYELYSALSMLVILFAIALRLRTREQLSRVLYVFAAVGGLSGLYGVSQHFGWDPIGDGENLARVYSSFGNPIFFGAYLTMSIVITLALAAVEQAAGRRRWWVPLIGLLVGLQLAGLWFTGSRGPWVGTIAGMSALSAGAALWLQRRAILQMAVAGIVGVVIGGAIVIGSINTVTQGDVPNAAAFTALLREVRGIPRSIGDVAGAEELDVAGAEELDTEAALAGQRPVDAPVGTLGSRFKYWNTALRLSVSWAREPAEPAALRAIRPLVGFGPDMSYYSYPLRTGGEGIFGLFNQPHNIFLHVLMENGFVGLLLFLALLACIGISLFQFLRCHGGGRTAGWPMIAAIALAAALAGRMVEQTVGLARPGDLTAFYGLVGVAAALRLQTEPQEQPVLQAPAAQNARARAPARVNALKALKLGSAAIVGVLALALFLAVDIQAVRASRLATTAQQALLAKDTTIAYLRFRRASELYPFVEGYALAANHLLRGSARQIKDRKKATSQLATAFEVLARFEDRDPYAYDTQVGLALTTAQLAALGVDGVKPVLRDRLEKLARLLPGYSAILSFTAHGLVLADAYEPALAHATRAIAIDPGGPDAQQAWWARGAALEALKRFPEAEKAYLRVLQLDPDGGFSRDAHVGLANVYQDLGQPEESQKHRSLADLKPKS